MVKEYNYIMMNIQKLLKNPELIQYGLFIDNKWVNDRETFAVNNPATDEVIASIASATDKDILDVIEISNKAFKLWRHVTAKQRGEILHKFYQLTIDNLDDLAIILTVEQGKPLAEAKNEIMYGASYVRWYAEEARRIDGYTVNANNASQRIMVNLHPVGVCAAIMPWNFPNAMLLRKLAPALAAGCTMIAKPASSTPLSTNALAYLANEAGIPDGVFNIIHGHSGRIGELLCASETVRKITFTGSTEIGVWLYQNSANTMKKLSLELGGNAPLIAFEDADIEQAVTGIMQSKYRNAGQTCVCSNRIIVHKNIHGKLLERLTKEVKKLKIGNGLDAGVQVGPLIDKHALTHAKSLIDDAIVKGAKVIIGGKESALGFTFFEPTIVDCVDINVRLFREEIFAPILAIYQFENDEEAIEIANNTEYGLASYIFTQNIKRVYEISEQLEYGIVGVNTGLISAENVPFGGVKMSGLGREGGKSGIYEYLVEKYVCVQL
jgi:succinate-semialdehyde dehydrogenase/glutarate-semialdehyde dehydrogenase